MCSNGGPSDPVASASHGSLKAIEDVLYDSDYDEGEYVLECGHLLRFKRRTRQIGQRVRCRACAELGRGRRKVRLHLADPIPYEILLFQACAMPLPAKGKRLPTADEQAGDREEGFGRDLTGWDD